MKKLTLLVGAVVLGLTSCYIEKPNTDFLRYNENIEMYEYDNIRGVQVTGIVKNYSNEEKYVSPNLKVWIDGEKDEYSTNKGILCMVLIKFRNKDGILSEVSTLFQRDSIDSKEELFYSIKSDPLPLGVEEVDARVEFKENEK